MSTNFNPDNYQSVTFEVAKAAPDACINQKMRDELVRILKGFVAKGRQTIADLLKVAKTTDNLASITKAGEIYVPAAKAWQGSLTIPETPADQDIQFTEFTEAGIDPTAETCAIVFWSTNAADVAVSIKTITADSLTLRVSGVSAGQEIFLRLIQMPVAGESI